MRGWTRDSPLVALLCGAVLGALAWTAALLMGFGAPLLVWTLGGGLVGVIWWMFRHVVPSDPGEGVSEPRTPDEAWPSGVERGARLLESRIRGARQGRPDDLAALHATIADIVRDRGVDPSAAPAVHAYLSAPPHTLTRARLRTILRELVDL